jgi:tRNA dimethylallyltransferase
MQKQLQPPAIFLMGPTASGKTALSVQLAQALGGEIISVDSTLVFKGMDIGTAKPTLEERGDIPHHLIDILDPSESFSTGQFRTHALTRTHRSGEHFKIPLTLSTGLRANEILKSSTVFFRITQANNCPMYAFWPERRE